MKSILLPLLLLASALSAASVVRCHAADNPQAAPEERDLIQILRAGPDDQKAIACKKLAIYGSAAAVPDLAPLLADERLNSWARIALEAIPGPAADAALREAAGKLNGRVLVGVINSIGVRRDEGAIGVLAHRLYDADPEVARAAAVALGKIGAPRSGKLLVKALKDAPPAVRPGVAQGAIRCAEIFMAGGKSADAAKLFDAVRHSDLPQQPIMEGIRGAILARGAAGIPLLLEELRSHDRESFNLGLRVARELPGREATAAVGQAFASADADRQPLLLLALADRGDPGTRSVVAEAARNGTHKLRMAAIQIMDDSGNPSSVPVLLEESTDADPEISQAALAALARLGGNDVDMELLSLLPKSSGKLRHSLIMLSARRGIEKAVPEIARSVTDSDADLRVAAIQALGTLGGSEEVAQLVDQLQKTTSPTERARMGSALVTLSARIGAKAVPPLLLLTHAAEPDNRKAALPALAAAGGPDALAAVAAATEDSAEAVQDEAVRTLCSWPNTWPEDALVADPLLKTAKSANTSHQILALRGYLQFLLGDEKLASDEKLAKLREAAPLLQRSEEKTLAIAVLQSIPTRGSLELLETYAAEPTLADAACMALIEVATKGKSAISPGQRKEALQLAIEKSASAQARRKAQDALKESRLD